MAKRFKIECAGCPAEGKYDVVYPELRMARILLVGEAPWREEAKEGRPFVGDSGKLLRKALLEDLGLETEHYAITNAVCCTIPDKKLIKTCLPYCRTNYLRVLKLIRPQRIIALGEFAFYQTLARKSGYSNGRGKVYECPDLEGSFIGCAYHPSYLLRKGAVKGTALYESWIKDLKVALTNKPGEKQEYQFHLLKKPIKLPKVFSLDSEFEIDEKTKIPKIHAYSIGTKDAAYVAVFRDGYEKPARELAKRICKHEGIIVVANRPVEEEVFYYNEICEMKKPLIIDIFPMAHLLDENLHISLESIANAYTEHHNIKQYADGLRGTPSDMPLETLITYAGIDARATFDAFKVLHKRIKQDKKLHRYWKKFVIPIGDLLSFISMVGIPIDTQKLSENIAFIEGEIIKETARLVEKIPQDLKIKYKDNLSITRNNLLIDWFYNHPKGLRLKPKAHTPTGLPSLREDDLIDYKDHPIIKDYLHLKKLHKLLSTYLRNIEKHLQPDNHIYPTTVLWRTVTGRTACFNPNIQNIPQRGMPYVEKVKELFAPPAGYLLGARDLSQSELRIMAWLADEKKLLRAFEEGVDPHKLTASLISGKPMEEITKEMRQAAKPCNFGLIYKGTPATIQHNAKVDYGVDLTYEEAEEMVDKWFDAYPRIRVFHRKVEQILYKFGYVRGVLGRLRRFPNISAMPPVDRARAERQAINFIIQNFSSDLALIGMYLFWVYTRNRYKGLIWPLMFIHDAVFFIAREDYMATAMNLLKWCMEVGARRYIKTHFGINIGYKIESDGKYGPNWAEMEEWHE